MGPLTDLKDPHSRRDEKEEEGADIPELLTAAADGDERAWRELVGRYGRRVFALAKSRCQRADVAEEITQSVFATIAAKLGRGGYAEQGRFESWLFRVAMNRIRDEMRRQKRQADPVDPATMGGVKAAEPRGDGPESEELDRLRRAIHRLPESDREIVELRHHGQMSFKEMAELLNEPLGTLLARHHRALRKLKQLMGDEGGNE